MNILPGMGLPYTGERQIGSGLGNQYYYEMPEFESDSVSSHLYKMSERGFLFKMLPRPTIFKMAERLTSYKMKVRSVLFKMSERATLFKRSKHG